MGVEELGSKEELRDYLGSLIHALRSHKPCTVLRRSDPLWCGKISCLRLASQWCLMHECWDSEKKCTDKKCMRSELVVTHWVNCTYARCFMCSPWIRPESLESQPKQFLDECFGTHCFLGRHIEPLLIKHRQMVDNIYVAISTELPGGNMFRRSKGSEADVVPMGTLLGNKRYKHTALHIQKILPAESVQINVTIVNADTEEEDEDNVMFLIEDEAYIEFTCKAPAALPQNGVQNGQAKKTGKKGSQKEKRRY